MGFWKHCIETWYILIFFPQDCGYVGSWMFLFLTSPCWFLHIRTICSLILETLLPVWLGSVVCYPAGLGPHLPLSAALSVASPVHPFWPYLVCSVLPFAPFSSVQSLSRVWLFATPWIAARQASLSITNSRSSLKLMSVESIMPSSHLILCRPLLLLPPTPPSIRVFSSESTLLMKWPKYWGFSFRISPSKEHPGLISFRMDWLDLLAVQGTLKSLLQHHSSKASILPCSAFFTVKLSHPYMAICPSPTKS